jgi:hypothetical protein
LGQACTWFLQDPGDWGREVGFSYSGSRHLAV